MYSQSSHPDPYAGQYPKPPPPPIEENIQPSFSVPMPTPQHNPPPVSLTDRYVPQQDTFYSVPISHPTPPPIETKTNDYHDPYAIPLQTYEAEQRRAYFQQQNVPPQTYQNAPVQQADQYYTQYQDDDHEAVQSPESPMVQQQKTKKKPFKDTELELGPKRAPKDEVESYRPRPYSDDRHGSSCNCCCYNPALTCCSCFCMLIAIAFCAGGIAMIVSAKVISDQCSTKCTDLAESIPGNSDPCPTLCGKVAHDGLFYGGIVVAALAGLSVIWRAVMWTCAGYSKR